MSDAAAFDDHQQAWFDYTASPWARIRYAVVRETLTRSLAQRAVSPTPGPLRILDVGGGDALDTLPLAAAGHDVTVLDPSQSMLEAARARAVDAGLRLHTMTGALDDLPVPGTFDAVLCHFVLQYRSDVHADLEKLVGAVRPGGMLSLIAPNPASQVFTRLLRQGPAVAMDELARDRTWVETFECYVRKLRSEEVEGELEALSCEVVGRYGGRIANDLVVADDLKYDADYYADLERLELALCDREPFWRTGAFWQLVALTPC